MNIVAIVGSARKNSYNKQLVSFMKERFLHKVEIKILPIEEFPIFNQDHELTPPENVKEVKSAIAASDGVLIATPEYNHSVPGVLVNAIDWFSRVDQVMVKKPVMIVGGATGPMGTVRAQGHLRQILNSTGVAALTLPSNQVFISAIHEKFDESGKLIHEPTISLLDTVMDNFVEWVKTVS